jgi:hypothetical protein
MIQSLNPREKLQTPRISSASPRSPKVHKPARDSASQPRTNPHPAVRFPPLPAPRAPKLSHPCHQPRSQQSRNHGNPTRGAAQRRVANSGPRPAERIEEARVRARLTWPGETEVEESMASLPADATASAIPLQHPPGRALDRIQTQASNANTRGRELGERKRNERGFM